ncbi:kinectin [Trichonephila clavipes]|nr:kinectin [Trichonephila clavipes]
MASEKMKTRYDARATGLDFHEGDKVWLWNTKRHKGLSPKLQTNWERPYTVQKRLNALVVRTQKSPHSKNRRDLELEVNEDDIEELIMGHEDELTTEELQEILNEEHQETQRNGSSSDTKGSRKRTNADICH